MVLKPCPSCGIYLTFQHKSDRVAESCNRTDLYPICDGCEAYKEHVPF